MTITLEQINAQQAELKSMIEQFNLQKTRSISFPATEIHLAEGEHYAGIIVGLNGTSSYHLILLPGTAEDIGWDDAMDWAKGKGGDLPNRCEQSLLFANAKIHFLGVWHWSCEQYADYAWMQDFDGGSQYKGFLDSNEYRARAVRRVMIGGVA